MKISNNGLNLIKSFEGLELEAYPDPGSGGDPWTIGYGHTGSGVRKGLVTQLAVSNKQHNAEGAIGQRGLSYDRQGTAQQEKTQSEIRQQVEREPCAKVAIPDASAKRLWQLAESTRAATLPDAARQPDSVAPAAATGK